jgi:hypothetical protein
MLGGLKTKGDLNDAGLDSHRSRYRFLDEFTIQFDDEESSGEEDRFLNRVAEGI